MNSLLVSSLRRFFGVPGRAFTRTRFAAVSVGVLVGALALPAVAFAQEASIEDLQIAIDMVWVVMAGSLVFLMHTGFTLVEAGFTRMKNAGNIVAKNLMNIAIGLLAYWLVGFPLMFGDGGDVNGFIGLGGWALSVTDSSAVESYGSLDWTGVSVSTKWFFQAVFAATAATIVSGAMAERTHFRGYLVYALFLTAVIYPVVGHWIWGGGWLGDLAFLDFAGSTVVHTTGGVAALVGAFVVGPRIGKYNGGINVIPGHSIPLAIAGVFILWFGWFGFNAGSTMAAVGVDFSTIIVTTNLAAAAGAVAAMLVSWSLQGKPDVGMAGNGALAGLVGITAGCAFVDSWASIVIGLVAGAIVVLSVMGIDRLRVDDPVGAISVHGICGIWGTLAVGLFAAPELTSDMGFGEAGLFLGGGFHQLWVQAIGSLATVAWTGLTCLVLFYGIKFTIGLRADRNEELDGLDISEHGMWGYPDSAGQTPGLASPFIGTTTDT